MEKGLGEQLGLMEARCNGKCVYENVIIKAVILYAVLVTFHAAVIK